MNYEFSASLYSKVTIQANVQSHPRASFEHLPRRFVAQTASTTETSGKRAYFMAAFSAVVLLVTTVLMATAHNSPIPLLTSV